MLLTKRKKLNYLMADCHNCPFNIYKETHYCTSSTLHIDSLRNYLLYVRIGFQKVTRQKGLQNFSVHNLLLGLEYKSRVFSQQLRPGKILHGHNFITFQHILIGFWGILSIDLRKVYHKYNYEWLRSGRVMTFQSLPCLLFQCVLY